MSLIQRQMDLVRRKTEKVEEIQSKIYAQGDVIDAQAADIRSLHHEKQNVDRQVGLLEVLYEDSITTLRWHEGRGGYGEALRKAQMDVGENERRYKEAVDRSKVVRKAIERAEKAERRANDKLRDLEDKLENASRQLVHEERKLAQIRRGGG